MTKTVDNTLKDTTQTMDQQSESATKLSSSKTDQSSPDELYEISKNSLEDSKALEIASINITGKSPICDYIIVASGRSHRHVRAISERLLRELKTAGFGNCKVEGLTNCDWVLIDASDVIIHIFRPEVREFYKIEKMWSFS